MKRRILQYELASGRLPKPEAVRKQLSILKGYGLTGVMLYMEAQAAQKSLPVKGEIGAGYLAEFKREVLALELEFIPQIQLMGHLSKLLSHEETASWRDFPDGGRCVRLDSREVRQGMKDYISEVSRLFDSDYIHCGCDEAFDIGLGVSREWFEENGFENGVANYLNEMNGHIRSLGKKMVIYADELILFPELRKMLDGDITVANWGYCSPNEVFEEENHHYRDHMAATGGRNNWITGNAMSEYVFPPFERLQANADILLELGRKSKAEAFVISDWASCSNLNPMIGTTIGSIYLLKRLSGTRLSAGGLSDEIAFMVCREKSAGKFSSALECLLSSQGDGYWPREICRRGPPFPYMFAYDVNYRWALLLASLADRGMAEKLENDVRNALELLIGIPSNEVNDPDMLSDVIWLARRVLAAVLRAEILIEHVWYAGGVYYTEKELLPKKKRYGEYLKLMESDLRRHAEIWNRDHFPAGLDSSMSFLGKAAASTEGAVHCPESSFRHYTNGGCGKTGHGGCGTSGNE